MREQITLSCGECKSRNYMSTKNKRLHTEKLLVKKFCKFCRKHTEHKESK